MTALIVGLGNPGRTYQGTRHNIGFAAVDRVAEKNGLKFKEEPQFKGSLAKGKVAGRDLILLKPLTFMNLSGEAVAQVLRYYHIDLSHLLILTDDVELGLGQLRIRIDSGPGSHNGLKSVREYLQTDGYARLRIGVGGPSGGELVDYVLGQFSLEEKKLVPEILERVVQAIEIWLDKGLTSAMNFANRKNSSTPSIGEKNEEK